MTAQIVPPPAVLPTGGAYFNYGIEDHLRLFEWKCFSFLFPDRLDQGYLVGEDHGKIVLFLVHHGNGFRGAG